MNATRWPSSGVGQPRRGLSFSDSEPNSTTNGETGVSRS
jgi:hypothetical protein